jgi:hypothetical protein
MPIQKAKRIFYHWGRAFPCRGDFFSAFNKSNGFDAIAIEGEGLQSACGTIFASNLEIY